MQILHAYLPVVKSGRRCEIDFDTDCKQNNCGVELKIEHKTEQPNVKNDEFNQYLTQNTTRMTQNGDKLKNQFELGWIPTKSKG